MDKEVPVKFGSPIRIGKPETDECGRSLLCISSSSSLSQNVTYIRNDTMIPSVHGVDGTLKTFGLDRQTPY